MNKNNDDYCSCKSTVSQMDADSNKYFCVKCYKEVNKVKTKEDILGPPCYPHECGSMVEVQPHSWSFKAMEEYSQSQLSEYKEKLKAEILQGCIQSNKVFNYEDVLTLIDKI